MFTALATAIASIKVAEILIASGTALVTIGTTIEAYKKYDD